MMRAEQEIRDASDTAAYRRLLWAVIEQALLDACSIQPKKPSRSSREIGSAFDFLGGRGLDAYLELLDVDPGEFRRRLWDLMHRGAKFGETWTDRQRRAFRSNYQKWRLERADMDNSWLF